MNTVIGKYSEKGRRECCVPMNIFIQEAVRASKRRVHKLLKDETVTVDSYSENRWNKYLDTEDLDKMFVAVDYKEEDDPFVVGFISLEVPDGHSYLYVEDLSVDEAYMNHGIGTSLLTKAEQYAKSIGLNRIELNVLDSNTNAARLYTRIGYNQTSKYTDTDNKAWIRMCKD